MEHSDVIDRELSSEKEVILRETLNLTSVSRKKEGEAQIDSLVEDRCKDLPKPLRGMLMDDLNSMKEVTKDKKTLKRSIDISYKRIMAGYERKLSGTEMIPNEAYAMVNAMDKVDALFGDKEPTAEDLKKVARVSFDLNGLKAVNDLNGGDHKKGDAYLAMAVDAIKSPEVIAYAKEKGLVFEPEKVTRDGGDEFGVIISSDQPLKQEDLDGFVNIVQDVFWDNDDFAKILDFNNPNVLAHFAGTDISEIDNKFGGDLTAFKKDKGIPLYYKYHGAMPGGAATLYDGLVDSQFDPKGKVKITDSYHRMLQKVIGAMFSSSDRAMDKNKRAFKEALSSYAGEDEDNMRFLAKVYSRTDKERELSGEVESLRRSLSKAESSQIAIKDLKEMIAAGASPETLLAHLAKYETDGF